MRTDTIPEIRFPMSAATLMRSRVEAVFIWSWNAAFACLVAGKGTPPVLPTLLAAGAMVLISLSVYLYNDTTDAHMDRLNSIKKNRPLPTGRVSRKDALAVVYGAGICGLTVLLFTSIRSFLFGLSYFLLFTAYSHPQVRLKKRFLFKESVIASAFPLTGLVGIYAVSDSFAFNAFFATVIMAVFAYLGQPALADSVDVEEDALAGVRSLATVLSWKRRIQLLTAAPLVIMIVLPLTYAVVGFSVVLPLLSVAGGLIFVLALVPLMRRFELAALSRAKKVGHFYFFLLQVSFILSSLGV